MPDETKNTEPPHVPAPGTSIRTLLFTIGVLFVIWLLFIQIAPRFLFDRNVSSVSYPQADVPATDVTEQLAQKDEQIAGLNSRIDTLEARLKTLEDVVIATPAHSPQAAPENAAGTSPTEMPPAVTPAPEAAPALVADESRLAGMEAKLLEQESSLQAIQSQIEEARSSASHQLATLTAFAQMREAIRQGQDFTSALDQLTLLLKDNAQAQKLLSELAGYAQKDIVTLAALKSGFESIIPKALAPDRETSPLKANLHALIRIRKVGERQQGADDESVIARAEAKIDQADIEGALAEMATLSPAASDKLAGWSAQAQDYLARERALDALQLTLVEKPATARAEPEPAPESESE
jgi:hypothetical protein